MQNFTPSTINPEVLKDTIDILIENINCLTYLSDSIAAYKPDDFSDASIKGLHLLMECVRKSLKHEKAELQNALHNDQ